MKKFRKVDLKGINIYKEENLYRRKMTKNNN